ncbi:hypothetical protein D3C79_1094970 [compost metagenome]
MLRVLQADQDMQGVLCQRRFHQHHPIAHFRQLALQVVTGHVLVFHRQAHPPRRQHAYRRGKVAHRHLVQAGVAVEFG